MKDNPSEIFKINRQKLKDNHVYSEKYEHDNCGVGLVASISGESRRDIVEKGVDLDLLGWEGVDIFAHK